MIAYEELAKRDLHVGLGTRIAAGDHLPTCRRGSVVLTLLLFFEGGASGATPVLVQEVTDFRRGLSEAPDVRPTQWRNWRIGPFFQHPANDTYTGLVHLVDAPCTVSALRADPEAVARDEIHFGSCTKGLHSIRAYQVRLMVLTAAT